MMTNTLVKAIHWCKSSVGERCGSGKGEQPTASIRSAFIANC